MTINLRGSTSLDKPAEGQREERRGAKVSREKTASAEAVEPIAAWMAWLSADGCP
jgi:hypothetical protein